MSRLLARLCFLSDILSFLGESMKNSKFETWSSGPAQTTIHRKR